MSDGGGRRITAPILMYHKVGADDAFVNVSAADFKGQMNLLSRLGYAGVTFANLVSGAAAPPKPVCVTFDDAYTCVADHAAPVLESLGWPATLFVPTAWVGKDNGWDKANQKPILPIMDWTTLKRFADRGWELAGHTRTHPRLGGLDSASALEEIAGGKQDIESMLNVRVTTFCYPYGDINAETAALVRQAGFAGACTTVSGVSKPGDDPYLLPRVKIAHRDGTAGLLYRLFIRPLLP